MWTEWKLDYLKRHAQQKCPLKAVGLVRRLKMGQGIGTLWRESAKDREKKNELSHTTKSDPEQVKVLIDKVLLAIKMNASMLPVQQTHNHVAKYVSLPERWRSKNDAFEFVNSINETVQNETVCSVQMHPGTP